MALTALDEHFAEQRSDRIERARRRRHGLVNVRLIRYADDFVIMVSGTKAHTEALLDEVAGVLSGLGLRFAPDKTRVLHIDEGLDFLGWRIQRHHKRVARVMRTIGLAGLRLRKKHRTTIPGPAAVKAADLIGRNFTAEVRTPSTSETSRTCP